MEFEITQTVSFEIEDLANAIIVYADMYLTDYAPDYSKLDNKQGNLLLATIFSKAVEILRN